MNSNPQAPGTTEPKPASPARGLLFMMGCLGLFYGLITIVDPLL